MKYVVWEKFRNDFIFLYFFFIIIIYCFLLIVVKL